MKYNIIERKVHITDKTREKLEAKLSKFDKFFREEATVYATFKEQKDWIYLEVTVQAGDMIIRAESDDQDAKVAIDKIVDVLEGQFRKYKTKIEKRLKQGAYDFLTPVDTEEPEETEFKVVKSKKFFMKPMSVEEAILQMNLLNHEFFVFTNGDTDGVNIVYRRKDKNYGLIEVD